MKKHLLITAIAFGLFTSCSKENEVIFNEININPKKSVIQYSTDGPYLKNEASYPIGTAVRQSLLEISGPTRYKDIVYYNYDRLTIMNSQTMWVLNNEQKGVYKWADADWVVDYAENTGKKIHGHALVWDDYENFTWLGSWNPTSTEFDTWMKDYIQTLIYHYNSNWPGVVTSWDVVNEAFSSAGIQTDNIYYQKLGSSYISKAFHYAHAADPDAKLFMTDFGVEWFTDKRWHFFQTAKNMKDNGVPIDGIGLQMHIDHSFNSSEGRGRIDACIREAAATGLLVFISELDIRIKGLAEGATPTEAQLQAQRDLYKFVVERYQARVQPSQRWGISTWGVGDADAYEDVDHQLPLLWSNNYYKKGAHSYFIGALQ